jgi:hypothetical protein
MGKYFLKFLVQNSKTAINFLSNKSSLFEDLEIILKCLSGNF